VGVFGFARPSRSRVARESSRTAKATTGDLFWAVPTGLVLNIILAKSRPNPRVTHRLGLAAFQPLKWRSLIREVCRDYSCPPPQVQH
jgi:hypothetical protein